MTDRSQSTAPGKAQQPNCDHEKMCKFVILINNNPCTGAKCREAGHGDYDTRTHTSASQQRIEQAIKELEKIKGSFKVIELRRSEEYEAIYLQIVELIALLQAGGHHE